MNFLQRIIAIGLLVCCGWIRIVSSHFGIQSGPDEANSIVDDGTESRAAGIIYDQLQNRVYLTGHSNGSFWNDIEDSTNYCFVASLELPPKNGGGDTSNNAVTWDNEPRTYLGTAGSSEACMSITKIDSRLYIGGNSQGDANGGLLSPLKPPGGAIRPSVFGMVLDVTTSEQGLQNNDDVSFRLLGGRLMRLGQVHYPVAMAMSPTRESIFAATLLSDDASADANYDPARPYSYPHGSKYRVYVERLVVVANPDETESLQETLLPQWDLGIGSADQKPLYVGGLVHAIRNSGESGDKLYVVGATEGSSAAFGSTPAGGGGVDDADGFVTEIDAVTGKLTGRAMRIASQPNVKDAVVGLCQQDGENNEVYLVGSTQGDLTNPDGQGVPGKYQAFLMKIQLESMRVLWTKQFGAKVGSLTVEGEIPSVVGVSCAVSADGEHVYLGGRTYEGAVIDFEGHQSFGGIDIVVAQYQGSDGTLNYIRQIGTQFDDIVADVTTDDDGNALVYGTTNGSLMRGRTQGETSKFDVFLMSVSEDTGNFQAPYELQGPSGGTIPDDTGDQSAPGPAGTPPPSGGPVKTESNSGGSNNSSGHTFLFVGLAFVGLVGILVVMYIIRRRRFKSHYPADSDYVVEYLKGFDDIEVDLKHSATGGWHGTYMNLPASGEGRSSIVAAGDHLSTKKIVQDSLFMDDYETPSLGGGLGGDSGHHPPMSSLMGVEQVDDDEHYDEREGLTGVSSSGRGNYDGLVDAYNSTWEDISPHGLSATRGNSGRNTNGGDRAAKRLLDAEDEETWGNEII